MKRISTLTIVHRSSFIVVFVIMALVTLAAAGLAQPTENVFIVNIDGMRWQDGPGMGSIRMPFLWDSLRHLGTLYTNFQNRGITVTNAGHSTITTGVRQLLQNNSGCVTPIRPREPTIGEYYRKYGGATPEQAVFVSGKNTIWRYPVSTYPGFGYDVAPTIMYGGGQDSVTWDSLQAAISRYHPKLCYTVFAHVDGAGHGGDTAEIIHAIAYADSVVYALWNIIQSDSIYRDRTTLLVTDDHGRHDDAHGGWEGHGDWCRGCRHVLFFAIGPEIKADTTIDLMCDQVNIAPTVGYLLDFPTPFAQGTPMTEMFRQFDTGRWARTQAKAARALPAGVSERDLSNSATHSRSPDIAVNPHGLHVVYTEGSDGLYEAYYTSSPDFGTTWTTPIAVLPSTEGTWYSEPVIAAFGDSGLFVAACGTRYFPSETTSVWMLSGRRSLNSGLTWEPVQDIDTLTSITCKPAIAALGNRIDILALQNRRIVNNHSHDGGVTFDTFKFVSKGGAHHPQWPSATLMDTTCFVVWQDCFADSVNPYHNIWFDRQPWQSNDTRITGNAATNTFSYQPRLTSDDQQRLHLAYCHLPDASAGNLWQVLYRQSANRGDTWTAAVNLTGSAIGYQPVIKQSDNGRLFCVWSGYDAGSWHVAGSHSADRGATWSSPLPITLNQSFSVEPRLALRGDSLYAVWEDLRDGNWEIYFRKELLSGRDAGVLQINYPAGNVDSTVAIIPAATFRNNGSVTSSFLACFRIHDGLGSTVYIDTAVVPDVAPGATVTRDFAPWPLPHGLGSYATWCSVIFPGDTNPNNDLLGGSFTIVRPPAMWRPKADFPAGPRGRYVKDGGCLAYAGPSYRSDPSDPSYVYALKGNNTCEFYSYNIAGDYWIPRESIPAIGLSGRKKTVKKGSAITASDGPAPKLYATKGNSTLEFWSYDPASSILNLQSSICNPRAYPWTQLPDVPLGAKTLREGVGAVAIRLGDTTFVYLLKGAGTNEFYRYHDLARTWQTMASAPPGASGKGFRYGSGIASDEDSLIYAIKARYNEFYAYNVVNNSWTALPSLPLIGRAGKKKAVAAGGGIAHNERSVYLIKGNNTQEFWAYQCDSGQWTQSEDVPLGTGKRVKGGGALVYAPGIGALYATKGSNTLEFYQYWPAVSADRLPLTANRLDNALANSSLITDHSSLVIAPNPFSNEATIRYSLPEPGVCRLSLYDVAGKLVRTLAAGYMTPGSYSISVHQRSSAVPLSSGIYLLKLKTGNSTATTKLIIE